MAVDMLSVCYADNRRRTSALLVRIMPEWGGAACLDIASAMSSKRFLSQVAVQNQLSELWMGRLAAMTHEFTVSSFVFVSYLKWDTVHF